MNTEVNAVVESAAEEVAMETVAAGGKNVLAGLGIAGAVIGIGFAAYKVYKLRKNKKANDKTEAEADIVDFKEVDSETEDDE